MHCQPRTIAIAVSILLLVETKAYASPVYKSTDPTGRTIYSNSPSGRAKSPHYLPEIMKGSFRAPALPKVSQGCSDRGGPDCASGPDRDGSIVCKDGTRSSGLLFRYICPVAKVEVLEVVQARGSSTASLVVKNVRSVTATRISLKVRSKSSPALTLKGPASLEEGSIAVYEVYIPKGVLPGGSQEVSRNQLLITCANCG